ncbi:unnamed protein product [Boreogadus saida]
MKVGSVHQSIEHYPDPFSCSSSRKDTGQQTTLSLSSPEHSVPHRPPCPPGPPFPCPHQTTPVPVPTRPRLSQSPPDHPVPPRNPDDIMNHKRLCRVLRRLWFVHFLPAAGCQLPGDGASRLWKAKKATIRP